MSIYLGDHMAFAEEFFEVDLNDHAQGGLVEKIAGTITGAVSDVRTRAISLEVDTYNGVRTITYTEPMRLLEGMGTELQLGSPLRAYLLTQEGAAAANRFIGKKWAPATPLRIIIAEDMQDTAEFQTLEHPQYDTINKKLENYRRKQRARN